jgi:single-strand DNA-binding protein
MKTNTNRVVLSARLTEDPELRSLPSGTSVCNMRVASNAARKDSATGEWVDKPNFFNVNVFGRIAEAVCRYLSKGSPVLVDGRLDWREWEAQDGTKRQAVEIIADNVEFVPDGRDRSGSDQPPEQSGGPAEEQASSEAAPAEAPVPVGAAAGGVPS